MNVFKVLLETYENAEENGLVDNIKDYKDNKTVLLPIFHQRKRSDGKNIIEIIINKDGDFIACSFLEKNKMIVFPVTEESQGRSGSKVCSHPIADNFGYVYNKVDDIKYYEAYKNELSSFVAFSKNEVKNFLEIIASYVEKSDILLDASKFLYNNPSKTGNYIVEYEEEIKEEIKKKTMDFEKIFITFKVQNYVNDIKDQSLSDYIDLHKQFIDYERYRKSSNDIKLCLTKGEKTYCTENHPGVVGKSKIISISNNPEPYKGRFSSGKQVTNLGYETSQKIHNMLNYFFADSNTRRYLGENSILINWFNYDISNELQYNILEEIGGFGDLDVEPSNASQLIDKTNKDVSDYIKGNYKRINKDGNYNILILNAINAGRAAIKYFQSIKTSELISRVERWYDTSCWEEYNFIEKKYFKKTFSLYRIADFAYGIERESRIILDNKKLKDNLVEDLVITIIEGRKISKGLVQKYFSNICNRSRYKNTFNYLLPIACSMIKKYYKDYENREVSIALDKNNRDRSYLYGRVLAVLEKIEESTYVEEKRSTNAERLWSSYVKFPAKTLKVLMDRLNPYIMKLSKTNKGLEITYDKLLIDLISIIDELEDGKSNKPLGKEFVFGYYSQRKEFFTKKSDKEKEGEIING